MNLHQNIRSRLFHEECMLVRRNSQGKTYLANKILSRDTMPVAAGGLLEKKKKKKSDITGS